MNTNENNVPEYLNRPRRTERIANIVNEEPNEHDLGTAPAEMRPEVQKYLDSQSQNKNEREAQKKQAAELRKKKAREKILLKAGLYTVGDQEVQRGDWYDYSKRINGVEHYYVKDGKVPLDVTDEEYEAILAAMNELPPEEEEEEEEEETESSGSWAAGFFACIAWIMWIGGLIVAIVLGSTADRYEFDFSVFLSNLLIYFAAGAVALCASELFRRLLGIHEELKEMNRKLDK